MFFEPFISLDLLILAIAIFVLMYLYTSRNYNYWKKRGIPYVKPYPFLGSFPKIFALTQPIYMAYRAVYEDEKSPYVGIFVLDKPHLVLRDPNVIKSVLVKGFSHFFDRTVVVNNEHDSIGCNMLFFMGYRDWSNFRKKISPMYTSGRMKSMYCLFEEGGSYLVNYLQKQCETTNELDFKEVTSKYTAEVIVASAFGLKANAFDGEDSDFVKAAKTILDFKNLSRGLALSCYFLLPSLVRLLRVKLVDAESANILRITFCKTLKQREDSGIVRNDLIDMLLNLRKAGELEKEDIDEDKMLAQAVQFFLGGYETTSSTIAFMLYELAKNQEIQNKLREEIEDVRKDHGRITYEVLHNASMKYLNMVYKETLRKYPVVPFVDRMCSKDFPIDGTDMIIEKGVGVFIGILGLHMDPEYFPNPEEFIPERFSDENKNDIRPYTYLPFGDGPRNCIGSRFAELSIKYGIVSVLLNFKFEFSQRTPRKMEFNKQAPLLSPFGSILFLKFTKLKCN